MSKMAKAVSMLGLAAVVGLVLVARAPDEVDDEKRSSGATVATSGEAANRFTDPKRALAEHQDESADERRMLDQDERPTVADASALDTTRDAQDQTRPMAEHSSLQPATPPQSAPDDEGRSFPVSGSILAACEPSDGRRPSHFCAPNKKLLEEMAEEPRNEAWASVAERAIRALVEQEPGKYTIRALECRSSICFVETASLMEGFHTSLYRFENSSGLKAGYAIHGTEVDEYGSKVYVTLYPFTRN